MTSFKRAKKVPKLVFEYLIFIIAKKYKNDQKLKLAFFLFLRDVIRNSFSGHYRLCPNNNKICRISTLCFLNHKKMGFTSFVQKSFCYLPPEFRPKTKNGEGGGVMALRIENYLKKNWGKGDKLKKSRVNKNLKRNQMLGSIFIVAPQQLLGILQF